MSYSGATRVSIMSISTIREGARPMTIESPARPTDPAGEQPTGTTAVFQYTFPRPKQRFGWPISMRWKLLAAFTSAFTLVFGVLAFWTFEYVTDTARNRLISELESSAAGGALGIDTDLLVELVDTVPAVPDPDNKYGYGYPDSPLYTKLSKQLLIVRQVVRDAGVYSYYLDPTDGELYFAATGAYLVSPDTGVTYKVPLSQVVDAKTYQLMRQGLAKVTNAAPYSDDFGEWISSFAPLPASESGMQAAIGLDYPLTYVDEVESDVQRRLLPILAVAYLVLLLLVLTLSTTLTRPLNRLTEAATRVAAGEYDLDLTQAVPHRFPDEMYKLAEAFSVMAVEVAQREQSLTQEVQRLKVEIDHSKREEAVREITDTDFFADLAAKAATMRQQRWDS